MTLAKTLGMGEPDPDVVAFFESDMPVSEWVAAPNMVDCLSDEALVVQMRQTMGRKFDATDLCDGELGNRLYAIAEEWLPSQTNATLPFLRDVATRFVEHGNITNGQAAGALNCFYAQLQWRK